MISIHALREEGDSKRFKNTRNLINFYPRPPRGGRHEQMEQASVNAFISIHALREEGDSKNREKIPAFIPL